MKHDDYDEAFIKDANKMFRRHERSMRDEHMKADGYKCLICGKPLSMYNPSGTCFCHSHNKDRNANRPKLYSEMSSNLDSEFNLTYCQEYGYDIDTFEDMM